MDLKKIKALSFLGWHFVTHFFKKLVPASSSGLDTFLAHYRGDRIFGVDAKTRARMPDDSRCYVCRLCDTTCPKLAENTSLLPPSYVVSAFARSLTDYALFQDSLFDCGSCRQCEAICPQNVPIADIIGFMSRQAESFRKAT